MNRCVKLQDTVIISKVAQPVLQYRAEPKDPHFVVNSSV
jgi:hypothetical protein